jgi:hypothetical protein
MKSPIYLSDLEASRSSSPIRELVPMISDIPVDNAEARYTRILSAYRSVVQVVDGRELHQQYLKPQVVAGKRTGKLFLLQCGHDVAQLAIGLADGSADIDELLATKVVVQMRKAAYGSVEAAVANEWQLTADDLKRAERLRVVRMDILSSTANNHLLVQCSQAEQDRLSGLAKAAVKRRAK